MVLGWIFVIGLYDYLSRSPIQIIITFRHTYDANVRPASQVDYVAMQLRIPVGGKVCIGSFGDDRIDPGPGCLPVNTIGGIGHTHWLRHSSELHVFALKHEEHFIAFGGIRLYRILNNAVPGSPSEEGHNEIVLFAAVILDDIENRLFPVDSILRDRISQGVGFFGPSRT